MKTGLYSYKSKDKYALDGYWLILTSLQIKKKIPQHYFNAEKAMGPENKKLFGNKIILSIKKFCIYISRSLIKLVPTCSQTKCTSNALVKKTSFKFISFALTLRSFPKQKKSKNRFLDLQLLYFLYSFLIIPDVRSRLN